MGSGEHGAWLEERVQRSKRSDISQKVRVEDRERSGLAKGGAAAAPRLGEISERR